LKSFAACLKFAVKQQHLRKLPKNRPVIVPSPRKSVATCISHDFGGQAGEMGAVGENWNAGEMWRKPYQGLLAQLLRLRHGPSLGVSFNPNGYDITKGL
jgi:hypothetical protein